jgi:hypothetical protein
MKKTTKAPDFDNSASTQIKGIPSPIAFKDLRLDATAQEKRASWMAHSARTRQLAQLQSMVNSFQSGSSLQRKLKIHGQFWDGSEEAGFREVYGADERKIMRAITEEIPLAPRTLTEVLASDMEIGLYIRGNGEYTAGRLDDVKIVTGGRTRTADGNPLVMSMPADGFEEMRISGLYDCLARKFHA